MRDNSGRGVSPSSVNTFARALRYPLDRDVLKGLLLIAAASPLTLLPWVGMLLWIALWLLLFRMSYAVLISGAQGNTSGPDVELEMPEGIVLRHMGLLLAIALFHSLLAGPISSAWLELLLGLLVMLLVPAAMMTLALSGRLWVACNPKHWLNVVRATGFAYFPASALLLAALFAQSGLAAWLEPAVGAWWWLFNMIAWFLSAWTLAAGFYLMGLLLYHNRDRLDFGSLRSERSTTRAGTGDGALYSARRLLAADRTDEAVKRLADEIFSHGAGREVHELYRDLLETTGRHRELVEHARIFVSILIHVDEDLDGALEIASRALEIDPGFEPRVANDVIILVRHAFERRRHRLVGRLTRHFAHRHPTHPHQPELYFLAAQSLLELGGDRQRAVRTVRSLYRRYPAHPLADEMARFLDSFDR